MSVRGIVKSIFPENLWPYLQIPYRKCWAIRRNITRSFTKREIIARAEKLKPYYQDKLSLEILSDRIENINNPSDSIFVRRAQKEGWTFPELYGVDIRKYSGLAVIYDHEGGTLEYARGTLGLCNFTDWGGGIRFIRLKDFLSGTKINDGELVALVMSDWNVIRFRNSQASRNLTNDIVQGLVAMRENDQYVDVFAPAENEVVIDAGAYIGDTALRFLKWGGDRIAKIYSFELDPGNTAKYEENLRAFSGKVQLVEKGTWDKDEAITISSGGAGSHIDGEGDITSGLTAIDSIVGNERVTFIKMDVEGAELKSLMGARNTIIKNHPRLAVCVYHKVRDIYEIPEYILSLVPEYRFYLRHYSSNGWETVLYAEIPK